MSFSKSNTLIFFFLATAVFWVGCKKDDLGMVATGESKVKYVNALTVEHAQHVSVDEGLITEKPLNFEESTDYIKVKSGNRSVSFWADGDLKTQSLINFTSSISYTTFLIANKAGTREIVHYEDNLSSLEMDKAKIRFINLSPAFISGINVNVSGGTQFINGLIYKEVSNYFFIDPDLSLRYGAVGSAVVKTIPLNTFQAGKVYNIWFSGAGTADLEAHVLLNN